MISSQQSGRLALGFALLLLTGCGTTTSTTEPWPDGGCQQIFPQGHDTVPGPPDGVAACPRGACNYQAQTGCASGSACRPQFSASSPDVSPGCEPAGAGTSDDACKLGSDCAPGYSCAGGVCRKQCCGGDWSVCPAGQHCFRALDVVAGSQIIDSSLELCAKVNDCDPLDPKPCPGQPGRECKIVDPTGAVACTPLSEAKEGEACGKPDACAAGLTCVGGTCRKLCRTEVCGEPACSPAEGTCVSFARDPAGVGECTPGW